jgi:cytochrome c oxidase accessory protein FixG
MRSDFPEEKGAPPSLDSVTTIRDDGSRRFLFPADVRGLLTRWRFITGYLLIIVFILLPWIRIGDHPAVFLDVATRRFHLFGFTLAAQDMWLLFFLITGLGFSLFFVTALLGRVWCGWACPHTVYLDYVFRPIERLIDGDAPHRRALDAQPWNEGKVFRRILKHSLYFLISSAIAHVFVSYFVSIPELWRMMSSAPGENWGAFVFIFIFSGILYFNFAWFREQLCIVICPYGRLQSALIDDNSMVIGYDAKRGEPRGKIGTAGSGDCIACNRCVSVCPTGIDIRQGLQMECIGCAACIDACDEIMDRVGKPHGLVRYDSLTGLSGGKTRWLRPRIVIYGLLLLVGIGVASVNFARIKPANFAVTRMVGTPYVVDALNVRNQFMVRIVNKSNESASFILHAETPVPLEQTGLSESFTLGPMEEALRPVVFSQDRARYAGPFSFALILRDETGAFEMRREARFLGPDNSLLQEEDREKGIQR